MLVNKEICLTEEQLNKLDLHSVINIINVINTQLQLIQLDYHLADNPTLKSLISQTNKLGSAVRGSFKQVLTHENLQQYLESFWDGMCDLEDEEPHLARNDKFLQMKQTFREIFEVMETRINELQNRWNKPNEWVAFDITEFEKDFHEFFHAVEKNSKGRYRILYNIAEQEPCDYLVHFNVKGNIDGKIWLPLLFKDVIRDLIANARKYTDPGGEIIIGLTLQEDKLRFVVEDTGYGIPEDEIEDVITFGYRASNVRKRKRTMGGGYGLTKALYVANYFKGYLWIDSALNQGTRITIELPLPDEIKNRAGMITQSDKISVKDKEKGDTTHFVPA